MADCCLILCVGCQFAVREFLDEVEICCQSFVIAFGRIVGVSNLQLRTTACLFGRTRVVHNPFQGHYQCIDINLFTTIFNSGGFNQIDMSKCLENELIVTCGIFAVSFVSNLKDERPFFRIVMFLRCITIGECQTVIGFNSVRAIGIV